MEWIKAVQDSGLGVWIRESMWGLFSALIVHTIAMGFVVGTSGVIAVRVLGLAKSAPFSAFARLAPVIGLALVFVLGSGLVLLIGYPAKALTNPLFYVKLVLAAVALTLTVKLTRLGNFERAPGSARLMAWASLVLWPAALSAGKYLAYTNHLLLVY